MMYMSVELLFPYVCQAGIMKMVCVFSFQERGHKRGWLQGIRLVTWGQGPQVTMALTGKGSLLLKQPSCLSYEHLKTSL